ncbi:MAG: hypothetical protein PHE15_02290, partial [Dehalococcoidales bacterium]|nr:hypothetical protein [Dehalococcoidales bacterium]
MDDNNISNLISEKKDGSSSVYMEDIINNSEILKEKASAAGKLDKSAKEAVNEAIKIAMDAIERAKNISRSSKKA